ncbi:MAG: hypothetical protein ACKO6Q_02335 [Bacteroidota bacterium]
MRVPFYLSFFLMATIVLASCGGTDHSEHTGHNKSTVSKSPLDLLEDSVKAAHDLVMPKMGKIKGAEKKAGQLLDSINLSLNKRSSMETPQEKSWKAALQSLIDELDRADHDMDQWMTEFDWGGAVHNGDARQSYLESEKVKVDKVKESILRSLSRADSLFAAIK